MLSYIFMFNYSATSIILIVLTDFSANVFIKAAQYVARHSEQVRSSERSSVNHSTRYKLSESNNEDVAADFEMTQDEFARLAKIQKTGTSEVEDKR